MLLRNYYVRLVPADRPSEPRAKFTTAKADCCPTTKMCVTVWMWTAWVAFTPVLTVAHGSVEWSAAATGNGFTSRWR